MADQATIEQVLDLAIKAAKAAGAHMRAHIGHEVEKTKSSKDDLVTVVDKQCQELVQQTIQKVYPSHCFLGEEDVLPGSDASSAALEAAQQQGGATEWLWIVDPIDGTTNFVHKRPASVVSVAATLNNQVMVGVIYDPYRNELFAASKGSGAFLNGAKISVSSESTFEESIVGFGIGTKPSVRLPMLQCVTEFSNTCRGIRVQGSAALELAWVSCGRQTAFYELDLNSWDIAAGALLVQEAGGVVTDSSGSQYSLRTRHCVASNGAPGVTTKMLECIEKANAVVPTKSA